MLELDFQQLLILGLTASELAVIATEVEATLLEP
jgi:hypothetical protein